MNLLPKLKPETRADIQRVLVREGILDADLELAGLSAWFRANYRTRNKRIRARFEELRREYPEMRRWVIRERLSKDFYLSRRQVERICRGLK